MKIGSFCKTNLKTYCEKDKWPEIHYLDTGNITKDKIDNIQTLIPGVDTIPSRAKRKVEIGDIIYSTVRPNQRHYGIITSYDPRMLVSTGFAVITVDTKIADPYYIYYFLTQDDVIENLEAIGEQSTSAYPSIKPIDIENLEIELPPLEKQQKIGTLLRTLERKCAINEKLNDNLQQQLLALYGELLATHDIQQTVELRTMCAFQEGYVNPSQTHPEYFDGSVKWLRAVDINESFIIETSRTLTTAGFESAKKSALLFQPNTIAISKSGTIGRLGIIADYMCGNRAVINIRPHNPSHLPLIYSFLKSKQKEFPDLAVGSVQKNLYVSILEPMQVKLPKTAAVDEFCRVGCDILMMIQKNCRENIALANLRDALLPKLMSGEVDVSAIQT